MKQAPDDFLGSPFTVEPESLGLTLLKSTHEECLVYWLRIEPRNLAEGGVFHSYGAAAYEFFLFCSAERQIMGFKHRVQQSPGAPKSFAPPGVPAWLLPSGAAYEIKWQDIAPECRTRIITTLKRLTSSPDLQPQD
ncbi:MAG TPA: hypothetical protein PKM25_10420 [Candidatus Ozemobacteraceae bacterium]|nr:hypothetical protein [Candidatus Ozemobacteraceae bacterium]